MPEPRITAPEYSYGLAYNFCQREFGRYLIVSCVHPGDPRAILWS